MRALFFGSPAFSVPCLDALHGIAEIVAVVCQPDRPAGRGLALKAPAVKERALELGLEVLQPKKVRTAEFAERLRALEADVGVVVAYGRILPLAVLDAPRLRCVNVHASILPRWRGAAPIQWAIAAGDNETGITLMQMDEGMDTGPILATATTPIDPFETAAELSERLARLGADVLDEHLPLYARGELEPTPQPEGATKAVLLTKQHGAIDWSRPAMDVHNFVRAMTPWPGAYTDHEGARIKVFGTAPGTLVEKGASPGQVLAADRDGIIVACGAGSLIVKELQESGRKRLTAEQAVAGRRVAVGDVWATEQAPPDASATETDTA